MYFNYSKYLAIFIITSILICRPAIKHIRSNLEYNMDRMLICLSFEKVYLVCLCISKLLYIFLLFQRIAIKQELKCNFSYVDPKAQTRSIAIYEGSSKNVLHLACQYGRLLLAFANMRKVPTDSDRGNSTRNCEY